MGVNGGLLIINADDFGLRPEVTDSILAVHQRGRISSATATVYMADTRRSAALARDVGLPLGLHLNLTYPYTGPDVPATVRERQRRLARYFSRPLTRYFYDPRIRQLVADCVRDQLDAFREVYGGAPTHLDGHHHIHTCPTVAMSPALAMVRRARCAHTYTRGERPAAKLLIRALQNRVLRARFRTPAALLPVGDIHPDLGGGGLGRLELAGRFPTEVMVHPQRPDEREALHGAAWSDAISRYQVGSYEQL